MNVYTSVNCCYLVERLLGVISHMHISCYIYQAQFLLCVQYEYATIFVLLRWTHHRLTAHVTVLMRARAGAVQRCIKSLDIGALRWASCFVSTCFEWPTLKKKKPQILRMQLHKVEKIQTPAEAKKKRECLVFFYIFCNQNIRLTALAAHGMALFVWNQLLQVQEMWETYREVTAADVFLFLMYLWSSWSSAIRPLLCFLQRHKQRSTTSLDAP